MLSHICHSCSANERGSVVPLPVCPPVVPNSFRRGDDGGPCQVPSGPVIPSQQVRPEVYIQTKNIISQPIRLSFSTLVVRSRGSPYHPENTGKSLPWFMSFSLGASPCRASTARTMASMRRWPHVQLLPMDQSRWIREPWVKAALMAATPC